MIDPTLPTCGTELGSGWTSPSLFAHPSAVPIWAHVEFRMTLHYNVRLRVEEVLTGGLGMAFSAGVIKRPVTG